MIQVCEREPNTNKRIKYCTDSIDTVKTIILQIWILLTQQAIVAKLTDARATENQNFGVFNLKFVIINEYCNTKF